MPIFAVSRVTKTVGPRWSVKSQSCDKIGPLGVVEADFCGVARFQGRQISLVCQIWSVWAGFVKGRIILLS